MKKFLLIAAAILLLPVMSQAADYNFISQDDTRDRIANKDEMIIVDICPVDQFAKGHLPGSLETNAYPVKTDEARASLETLLPQLTASTQDIIVVCPGGGGGAKRTCDYYISRGIAKSRLLILIKGMNNWPYQTVAK